MLCCVINQPFDFPVWRATLIYLVALPQYSSFSAPCRGAGKAGIEAGGTRFPACEATRSTTGRIVAQGKRCFERAFDPMADRCQRPRRGRRIGCCGRGFSMQRCSRPPHGNQRRGPGSEREAAGAGTRHPNTMASRDPLPWRDSENQRPGTDRRLEFNGVRVGWRELRSPLTFPISAPSTSTPPCRANTPARPIPPLVHDRP